MAWLRQARPSPQPGLPPPHRSACWGGEVGLAVGGSRTPSSGPCSIQATTPMRTMPRTIPAGALDPQDPACAPPQPANKPVRGKCAARAVELTMSHRDLLRPTRLRAGLACESPNRDIARTLLLQPLPPLPPPPAAANMLAAVLASAVLALLSAGARGQLLNGAPARTTIDRLAQHTTTTPAHLPPTSPSSSGTPPALRPRAACRPRGALDV